MSEARAAAERSAMRGYARQPCVKASTKFASVTSPTTVGQPGPSARPSLGRNVYAVSAVSFFTDASSEMIYPLLPVFLTTVLGASAGFLGVIEGAAETTAALLKL